MNTKLILSYEKIFGDKPEDAETILESLDYRYTLTVLAQLNSMVRDQSSTLDIYKALAHEWSVELKEQVFKRIWKYMRSNGVDTTGIFNRQVLTYFISYELDKQRNVPDFKSNSDSGFTLFKAYVYFNEQYGELLTNDSNKEVESDLEFFQKRTWPILIRQYNYGYAMNFGFEFYKAIVCVDAISKNDVYFTAMKKFLEHHRSENLMMYLMDLVKKITLKRPLENPIKYYIIESSELGGNLDSYTVRAGEVGNEFRHLMITPLFKLEEKYVVLDWDFLNNKIYQGTIYDFYKYGIQRSGHKISFNEYSGFLGLEVIEKHVFRPILSKIFYKKHMVLDFDNNSKGHGMLDAVVLDSRSLFAFELKNSTIDSGTFLKGNVDEFKEQIDKKVILDKGISQIYKWLDRLTVQYLRNLGCKLDLKKLTVYPILVVTDPILTMNGVDDYAKKNFDSSYFSSKFKHCHSPVVIPLSMLFCYIGDIRKEGLGRIIKRYNKSIRTRIKNLGKKPIPRNIKKEMSGYLTPYQDIANYYIERNLDPSRSNKGIQDEMINEIDIVLKNAEPLDSA